MACRSSGVLHQQWLDESAAESIITSLALGHGKFFTTELLEKTQLKLPGARLSERIDGSSSSREVMLDNDTLICAGPIGPSIYGRSEIDRQALHAYATVRLSLCLKISYPCRVYSSSLGLHLSGKSYGANQLNGRGRSPPQSTRCSVRSTVSWKSRFVSEYH